ncbi:MAG TPA: DUF2795 domain-containing protein [Bacteroidales bacterium]|nr:DUF2795 domain-containing protein [Bacteroidales bacterium]
MAKIKTAPIQVQKYLKGISYPVDKKQLIEHARNNDATDDIISMLEGMKSNRFNDPSDVSKALKDSE